MVAQLLHPQALWDVAYYVVLFALTFGGLIVLRNYNDRKDEEMAEEMERMQSEMKATREDGKEKQPQGRKRAKKNN